MFNPAFWLNTVDNPSEQFLTKNEIKQFNKNTLLHNNNLISLELHPEYITAHKLKILLDEYGTYNDVLYTKTGDVIDISLVNKNIDFHNITTHKVIFGITIDKALIRRIPTHIKGYGVNLDWDILQESVCLPFEPVVILHTSLNKKWYFIRTYNYLGWIYSKHIAIANSKEEVISIQKTNFLLVTGKNIIVDNRVLPMGTIIPLIDNDTVKIPYKDSKGNLYWSNSSVAINSDVNVGFLEFNPKNILTQAFKMLHMPYIWGEGIDGIDCSSFVGYIYRCFGFLLPRNSNELQNIGLVIPITSSIDLNMARIGDLIHLPGHITIYLGKYKDVHYIIHASAGMLGCVAITSVYHITSKGELYINKMNSISKFTIDKTIKY